MTVICYGIGEIFDICSPTGLACLGACFGAVIGLIAALFSIITTRRLLFGIVASVFNLSLFLLLARELLLFG